MAPPSAGDRNYMVICVCSSVFVFPLLMASGPSAFIAVKDAQGFQRTTASVNNATRGRVCLSRALSSMLAIGEKNQPRYVERLGEERDMGTKFSHSGH